MTEPVCESWAISLDFFCTEKRYEKIFDVVMDWVAEEFPDEWEGGLGGRTRYLQKEIFHQRYLNEKT